jgi:WD repeat-containing protein 23
MLSSLDFKLHIFDMRKAPVADRRLHRRAGLLTRMPVRKVIQGEEGNWTITDADLSPNNQQYVVKL